MPRALLKTVLARRYGASGTPRIGGALRLRGGFVHVHSVGEGRPVLLLHGSGSLAQDLLGALPSIEGIRWIAPDRPGHGFTEPIAEPGPAAAAGWLADLIDVMDLAPVQVVAHAMAAGQALWLAAAHPGRVRALTLLAPFCAPVPRPRVPLGLRALTSPLLGPALRLRLLPHLVGSPALARHVAPDAPPLPLLDVGFDHALRDQALLSLWAELDAFSRGMALLPRVDGPVLAVTGSIDRIARPEVHLPWLQTVAPQLEVIGIVGAGYSIHHDTPGCCLAAILRQAEATRPPRRQATRAPESLLRPGWQDRNRAV